MTLGKEMSDPLVDQAIEKKTKKTLTFNPVCVIWLFSGQIW